MKGVWGSRHLMLVFVTTHTCAAPNEPARRVTRDRKQTTLVEMQLDKKDNVSLTRRRFVSEPNLLSPRHTGHHL
jgi:hypothetical protein